MKYIIIIPLWILCTFCPGQVVPEKKAIVSYITDPGRIGLFWKDDEGEIFGSIENLRLWAQDNGRRLLFAMNGGMYMENRNPLGLFIQDGRTVTPLNKTRGYGNFYIQPNGVFYISKENVAGISKTEEFSNGGRIKYATQSGPLLVINKKINEIFKKDSPSRNIRNGIGILPGNRVICAISLEPISFYDFADFFLKAGCINALYLDGVISMMYLPEKKLSQTYGNFGVLIGVTEAVKK